MNNTGQDAQKGGSVKRWVGTLATIAVVAMLIVALPTAAESPQGRLELVTLPAISDTTNVGNAYADPWMIKPVLYYLVFTKDEKLENDLIELANNLSLTQEEMSLLQEIAKNELLSINAIKMESDKMLKNNSLALQEKEFHIINYNNHISQIIKNTDTAVRNLLGNRYPKFRAWVRQWWNEERVFRASRFNGQNGATTGGVSVQADIGYRLVYATQYNGYTNNEIALPDKYVKWANLGRCGCPSAYNNPPYTSILVRNPYSVFDVPIKEVGPWNENDNYWDSPTGSNPRRKFTNLPLGKPETEAAYFDNYNNGKDEFGRTVTNPAGVDLTPTVASQLGLRS